ncbi:sequestosome-1 [Parasteatoda tepidariorum]|uniref:sequestosome-1 n=1 Tax=Parasteatoda tepidariorum TaxID=114398 RepID=UPI00077F93C8|nr:sequestosome-1 [Parasteatoda tepidariorum]
MVHIIKVYFTGPNQNVEIRRLTVNSEIVSRFDLLVRKIREMFPVLATGYVQVTWKDSENDVIHMSSDEELAQALASADDDILRIYAYSIGNKQAEERANHNLKSDHNEMHPNIICDGCDKTVYGYRYKCLQCQNFDLCSSCNAENKHEHHDMIKLSKPIHIPREWVFYGARKFWRSMFGRCPAAYFTASASTNQNEKSAKQSDSGKDHWHGILDELLKGGCVSAEKLMKENLGGFLNFMESVSGNMDVKLERDPPKPSNSSEKQDNKNDEKNNNDSSKVEPTPTASTALPAEEYFQKITKAVEDLGFSNLFPTEDIVRKSDKLAEERNLDEKKQSLEKNDSSAVGDSVEKRQGENSSKPCGLFGDNEASDGWTILNKQEEEKKDTASANDNGAKPKYSGIYPSIFEKVPSSEGSESAGEVCAETKVKEIPPVQTGSSLTDAQILPKPAVAAVNESDKFAKLNQNENVAINYDPEIMNALVKMQAMGFTNEGGWLERLLITKDGNINATLDALYPNTRRR